MGEPQEKQMKGNRERIKHMVSWEEATTWGRARAMWKKEEKKSLPFSWKMLILEETAHVGTEVIWVSLYLPLSVAVDLKLI